MFQKFQHFLSDKTHGLIYSRKESFYVLVIIILVVILLISVIVRAFV